MLLEFIAAVVVAIGCGGAAHLANRVLGGRLPGWAVPAAAGAGMIGFVVWAEYTWAERTRADLPAEVSVVSQNAVTAWFRPWTYVWPLTNRMTVIDHRFDRTNPDHPHLVMTSVVMLGRWEPGRQVPVVFDCRDGLRADLRSGVVIADDGSIQGADWLRLRPDDPMLRIACERGRTA